MATIAYRRLSGAIGLTDQESGTRGLWWEKRRSLWDVLRKRGHDVRWFSKMTKPSKDFQVWRPEMAHYADVLILEFGGTNMQFYGKDIEESLAIARAFKGPKVFLSDDPDLPMLWNQVPWGGWRAWYNATKPKLFPKHPYAVPAFDFPFSACQVKRDPVDFYQGTRLAYIGRPNGREAAFKNLIAHGAPFRAFGRASEWEALGVLPQEPPTQPNRSEFYRLQIGCLAIADKKHKQIGFRTGRAYHAILAGCPVVAEPDHPALGWARTFDNYAQIKSIVEEWRDPGVRRAAWVQQSEMAIGTTYRLLDAALKEVGL